MDRIGEVFMKEKIKKNIVGFMIGVITTFSISVIKKVVFQVQMSKEQLMNYMEYVQLSHQENK